MLQLCPIEDQKRMVFDYQRRERRPSLQRVQTLWCHRVIMRRARKKLSQPNGSRGGSSHSSECNHRKRQQPHHHDSLVCFSFGERHHRRSQNLRQVCVRVVLRESARPEMPRRRRSERWRRALQSKFRPIKKQKQKVNASTHTPHSSTHSTHPSTVLIPKRESVALHPLLYISTSPASSLLISRTCAHCAPQLALRAPRSAARALTSADTGTAGSRPWEEEDATIEPPSSPSTGARPNALPAQAPLSTFPAPPPLPAST